ncbi:Early endosome antigen 1 [Taenia crassiceps]|uniref:Early endosome antigen 1 n=1 Tax=Taenia crassiceps TaxID=6207 RepID=A0ABR4Q9H9_9CEST
MLKKNSPESPPSTSSSSVGSDTETGVAHVPPTPPRRTQSALDSPEPVLSATISLGRLSLDNAPLSESEMEESETEKSRACTDGEVATTTCEGCRELEERLQVLQMEHTSVSNRLSATVADLHTVKKAMEETDTRARAEKALFEEQTASFEQRVSQLSQRLDSLLKQYQEYRRSTESEFSRLEQERASAQMELSEVEEHYRTLLRKRHDAAAEMSAPIDLPSSKEDLELYALQMREELLSTAVACEHLRNRLDTETATNRDRLNEERWKRIQMEELLRSRTRDANEHIAELTRNFEASKQTVERATERASVEVKRLQAELVEKDNALHRARDEVAQLRNRVSHLQTDLENTEKVSLDFVRLSQHLQIQLERQREQTQEVRWQDPQDVIQCSGCKRPFEAGMVKQNCRHCGAIFCRACLAKVIPPSGARSRPAHVCDMCHTLLVKDAAPYFSSGTFPRADGESSSPSVTPGTLRKGR